MSRAQEIQELEAMRLRLAELEQAEEQHRQFIKELRLGDQRSGNELFLTTFEQMAVGMAHVAPDGRLLRINRRFCDILGYSQEELINHSLDDVMHPDDLKLGRDDLERVLNGSLTTFAQEKRYLYKDGLVIWGNVTVSLVRDTKGKPKYFITVLEDITERKRAEETLQESEQLLTNIVESMSDGILVLDRNFHLTYWNRAMERISKTPRDKIIGTGKKAWELFPHLAEEGVDEMMRRAMQGEVNMRDDIPYHLPDGTAGFTCEVFLPLKNPAGEVRGVVGVIRDITATKRVDEERRQLEVQLRHSQKMETIGTLAGGIAHDFNNILTPVCGYLDMALADLPPDSSLKGDLDQVRKGAARAADLVQQILIFGRRVEQEEHPIWLHSTVEEALELAKATLPSTIKVQSRVDPNCERVMADPTQIHQLVMNLVTNAYHAMRKDGGLLELVLEMVQVDKVLAQNSANLHEGRYVKLTACDTGHGMDNATMERVFEPFFTTKEVSEGSGLGLSVAHGIVRNHGGEITVQSELGKGSAFSVYLPPVEASCIISEVDGGVLDNTLGGQERILFVDDEEEVVRVGKRMLERLGYEVSVETSSFRAMELLGKESEKFDLVVTDQTMPELTGYQLAEKIKELNKDIPIVMISGFGSNSSNDEEQKDNICSFVRKPFSLTDLAIAVRTALSKTAEK